MDSQEWRGENSPGLNQRGQPPPQQQPPPPQSPSTPGLYMYGGGQQGAGPSHHHQQLQQQHHNHPQHQLHHRYEPGSSGGGHHHHHPHPLRFPHHRSLEQLQNPEPVSPYGPTYYDLDQNRLYTPRNTGSMMNPGNVGLPYGHPHYHPHHNPHHPLPPPHHNLHHHNPSPQQQQQQQQQQTHHPPPPPPPLQTQADPSSKYPPVGNIIAKHERTPSAMSSETEESWSPTTSPISATPSPLGLPPQYSSTKEFYPQGPPQPQPGPPGHRLDTHTPDTTGYIHTPTDYSDVRMMPPPPTPREAPYNQLVNLSPPWAPSSNVEQKPALGPLQQQVQQHLQQQQQQHLTKKKRGRPYGSKNKPKQAGEETPTSGKQMAMASEVAGASGTETGLLTTGGVHERVNGSSSGKRNRKKQNEDAAVNTVLSLDVQSTEQLAVLPFPSSLTTSGKGQKKVWGPVVHAEKDAKRHTLNYSIINVSRKSEDDKDSKKQKPTVDNHSRNLTPFRRPLTKKKLMTLCQEMDTHTRDTSWVCALCKQGSHYRALGDLFGPYYVNVESKLNSSPETGDHSFESNSRNRTQSDTRRKSDDSSGERKQRKNSQTMNEMQTNSLLNDSHEGKMAADQQQEVWFHEDCVVWSSGVYLVGNRIRNIEEVVKDSSESVCCGCKLSGANLGCLHKGCSSRFHYLCAREKGCVMDEENFSIYCVKHKKNQR